MTTEAPTKPRSILALTADMEALRDLLEECGGDISNPETEAAVLSWVNENAEARTAKVEAYCQLVRVFELEEAAIVAEMDRLKARATVKANAQKALKSRLMWAMGQWAEKKIDTGKFVVSVAANGGVQPIEVEDESKVPEEFGEMKWHLDAAKVRKAVADGKEVPGVKVLPRGSHLRIK